MRKNYSYAAPGPLSVDRFLALEAQSTVRHEYIAGSVYAMSGTTARHNKIALNVVARLRGAARTGCEVYIIDLKVRAGARRDRIYYPDAVVVCRPHADDALVFDEPSLIVEVTSPATRRLDRGEKLDSYLAIPSLQAYLIVEHARRFATLYTRDAASTWSHEDVAVSGQVVLPCPLPGTVLSLDDIYAGLTMPLLAVREEGPLWGDDWDEVLAAAEGDSLE